MRKIDPLATARSRRRYALLALAPLLLITACAGYEPRVRYRASREFRCPKEKLTVEDIGTGGFLVTGCGYQATYVCGPHGYEGDIMCVRQ